MKRVFELINKSLSFDALGQNRSKKHQGELPLITISREHGSGGSIMAEIAGRKLGRPWKVYHQEILAAISQQSNLEKKLIEEVDEKRVPLIEEIIGEFFGNRYPNLSTYYKQLVRILSTIGNRGHAIIVGRGANFLFPNALKIRVVGDNDMRIAALMKYEKLSKARATKKMEDTDTKRNEFVKAVFRHDPRKAHHYDLVIKRSDKLSVEDGAQLIVKMAQIRFKL